MLAETSAAVTNAILAALAGDTLRQAAYGELSETQRTLMLRNRIDESADKAVAGTTDAAAGSKTVL